MPQTGTGGQGTELIALFQGSNLTTYQKVVASEYHDHSLIARLLHDLLTDRFNSVPLRLLDLGCGDASFMASIMGQGGAPLPLASYTGVDLSSTSLQHAAQQAMPGGCQRHLIEQDMLSFLHKQLAHQTQDQQQEQPAGAAVSTAGASREQEAGAAAGGAYDVVLCSLAAHHLSLAEKQELLRLARAVLAPRGCLLLMDVFRREGESREAYMARAHGYYFGEWDLLTQAEAEEIWSHVSVHDFPETESEYRRMAAAAGFAACEVLHTCRWEYTKVLALSRD